MYDVYNGNGPALKSGAQIPIQDVSLFISALAYATNNLCFGITASTTYENPYALARKFSTLDQLSNGRIGWNIVRRESYMPALGAILRNTQSSFEPDLIPRVCFEGHQLSRVRSQVVRP